jgi:hypothetical protein
MLAYEVKGRWGAACRRWGVTADGPFDLFVVGTMIPSAPRGSKHRVTTDEKMILGSPAMGAKMGRFDKVACLRFDERKRPDLAAAGPPTPPRSGRDHVTCSAATANAPPLVSITRAFSGCTPPRSECIALYF